MSLALLWQAERRLEEWRDRSALETVFKTGLWFGWVLPALLAGIVFGLAVWLPRGRARYRRGRALALGLPPLLLLLHFYVVWGVVVPRDVGFLDFLNLETPFWEAGPQFALAVLLGIAVTSGYSEEGPP